MERTQLSYRIIELTADMSGLLEQAAGLLLEGFRNRTEEWQDLDSARREVIASLAPEKLSRVAVGPSGQLLGWIGGIPMYRGLVWELHPLVVPGRIAGAESGGR